MRPDQKENHDVIDGDADSDLAKILDLANDKPVILRRGNIRNTVERDPRTPAKPFDYEAFCNAARKRGDSLRASEVHFDQWKRQIRYDRGHDDAFDE